MNHYQKHTISSEIRVELIKISTTTMHSLATLEEAYCQCGDIEMIKKASRIGCSVRSLMDLEEQLHKMYHPYEAEDKIASSFYKTLPKNQRVVIRWCCRKHGKPLREFVYMGKSQCAFIDLSLRLNHLVGVIRRLFGGRFHLRL